VPDLLDDLTPVKRKGDSAAPTHAEDASHAGHTPEAMVQSTTTTNEDQPSEFSVPVERQQQIGVTYATIEKRPLMHAIRAVGLVAYDKQRHWDYVTRVEGYVKKLFVFSRGELVEKDAPILTIYSPTCSRRKTNSWTCSKCATRPRPKAIRPSGKAPKSWSSRRSSD